MRAHSGAPSSVERASSTKRTPSNRSRCSPSASRRSSHRASPSAARAPWRAPASCRGRRAPRPLFPLLRNPKPLRAPSWANLPSQAVGVVDQLVDRSLRNQRAPVRYRTEGGGEDARGTGIEAPLLQFSFCAPSSLLFPLSSLLERPRCAEKEGAPKFLLLFRSRKSRKRAAQKLLPESWCGARLFTHPPHTLPRPPHPPSTAQTAASHAASAAPPQAQECVTNAASSGVVGVMTVS